MLNGFLEYITPALGTALGTVITALAAYLIVYINKKKKVLQETTDNALADKYLDMITNTITKCVEATNQTYVDALKKTNAFTEEAQKEAFNRTLKNILSILNQDCISYLETITDDVNGYITNMIEAGVRQTKWEVDYL